MGLQVFVQANQEIRRLTEQLPQEVIGRPITHAQPPAASLATPARSIGGAVGAGIGAAMKGLSAYDSLKNEAMGQMSQVGNVAAAAKRGLKA